MPKTFWKHAALLVIVLSLPTIGSGETKRCLFIGDSYFSHNDLSQVFLEVWSCELSDTLLIANHNRNGATIISQWENDPDDLFDMVKSQIWDYVIIELPALARPQDSTLARVLYEMDVLLTNCNIICITMDFCNRFPEMLCAKDPIEGIRCNEFFSCNEKMVYVQQISDDLENHNYKNAIVIIPFAQYRHFLYDQYSIELGSDDNFGHPSSFSHIVLARFILLHIINRTTEANAFQCSSMRLEAMRLSLFHRSFYHEIRE